MHTFCDDRGRSAMSIFDHLPMLGDAQFNASTMYAGAVKAWHRHFRQDDHWCVLAGNMKIGLFNSELDRIVATVRLAGGAPGGERVKEIVVGPQRGATVYLGEHQQGVLHIPASLWHGGVAVGQRDALLLYCVTRKYNPDDPDEERAGWDAFDFNWGVEFK
jgi:dTDP-4-dehydrorhamnose 3,5-epimerase